ncbi:hypothetical protein M3Y97_00100300 [Aphelenchoides bicaudatus]|nr:hypothetical protein M3Y97_00100300 [Aphelenchoides bicaudatus]
MLSTVDRWLVCLATTIIVVFDSLLPVDAKTGTVRLNVYFEPQNADSTKLIKTELLPLFQDSEMAERISLKLTPSGRATCNAAHKEYTCNCPNGDDECELIHLMSCTLHDYRHHEDAIELIACIQGQPTRSEANRQCIRKLPENEAIWLRRCPNEFRGKYLSWINSLRTKALTANLTSVPLLTLNSRYKLEPVNVRQQLCEHLSAPKPSSC